MNITVLPAEPGYKFIYLNIDDRPDIGIPVVAWRIVTTVSTGDGAIHTEMEGLDAFGNTGRSQYLGIAHPKGYLKFFDGREFTNWDELQASESAK